ncbi:glycosyltransferase family 2 protein [Paenibacillus frigoriresistens]|uniref:glycosyltransferase family 2 protein n=1 Tax=Paenibacillus alginolyticus TaxID=59839 RepID=UPI001566ACB2|nr:glycosyltransferase family 2 protein [Paenibacillus frigoriresistens]NRF96237.1 glycosyltransferase family 2 protein [Paenibacillus frigoriresistens]
MDLSIIIVNFKTRDLTLACLQSVFSSATSYTYEVILIDNASNDGIIPVTTEQFPQVICIANTDNVGFSKANNQGIRIAKGRYVLLLNSDTIVQPDTLDIMLRFMDENPTVGASGCKIVLPDGSLDRACKRGFPTPSASFYYAFGFSKLFPKTPRFNQYQLGYLSPNEAYPIDSLVGAFMLIRREAIEQVGMLDEEFFMYGEDIDWCYRIKEAGWVNYYYPRTQIVHHKGASSRRKPFKIIYEFHRAMILFHNKHYRKKYSWLTNAMVYAGVSLKFMLSLVRNKLRPAR